MEGVVFSLCESLDIFRELGLPVDRVLCSGGGSRGALWRQIQADVFGMPVEWRGGSEHFALGAAMNVGASIRLAVAPLAGAEGRLTRPDQSAVEANRVQRATCKHVYLQRQGSDVKGSS